MSLLRITLIGGPTALIEIDGFRLLTDPTFDAPGAYQLPHVKLEKLTGPALGADTIGNVDAVLLSHDQHSDNLDHSDLRASFDTLGLPIIRTSVDHGTAFDIAGKGIANEDSLIEAIDYALQLGMSKVV